ncbi:MAG: SH3 domain-containing protein [Chloroflexi bacterium]|nr:SH3 domain-containing protein [Chloroflexota bacterium]
MKRFIVAAVLVTLLAWAGLLVAPARPAEAQGGIAWQAEFYNNRFLSGSPVWTTQFGDVAFNWGAASPAPGVVNEDDFTARFATDVYFSAGTYRFFIQADDAIKLWIDYPPDQRPVLETFTAPRPGEMLTVDVTLTAGFHHIQVDYREDSGDAYLYVDWGNAAANPTPPTNPVPINITSVWTAQYYDNPFLQGLPVVTRSESTPSYDWGSSAPVSGVPADNFSARWTTLLTLDGGTYEVSARADDGVRVYVDSSLVINEFHGATGLTYTNTVILGAGPHTIIVEYYEATSLAYLDFSISLPGGSGGSAPLPPAPPPVSTGATATVTAYRLNVRDAPSASTGNIITKINRDETYPVLARNQDSSWWQIYVNGTAGWVSGRWVAIDNTQNVPVASGTGSTTGGIQPPVQTGYYVTARENLNIRSGPSTAYSIIGRLPYQQSGQVIGRNASSTWWQIQYQSTTGWVSGYYSTLQSGADIDAIPITAN